MPAIIKVFFIVSICTITGCSARAAFDSIQLANRNDCSKVPSSQYEECIAGTEKSYKEYERERQAVLKPDSAL